VSECEEGKRGRKSGRGKSVRGKSGSVSGSVERA